MTRLCIKLLILFSALVQTLYAQETLPDRIYFKTPTQGFSHANLYTLKDGKLWIKPDGNLYGKKSEWELFEKTGLPGGKNSSSFETKDRLISFSTEGTMITAVSNKGRFYFWQPTMSDKTTWTETTGSPFEGILNIPAHKCWSFSMSVMRAPWKRITPMPEEDIVSWWEDADGNKTEFGFTATIFTVDPDGQRIRYTDTGLPVSWHKAFASPERGTFIIENMSTSASTIFVINSTGKMYTRMMDYEMEGGCPGLVFVYDHAKRSPENIIFPLMESVRTLPLPGWMEQPPVEDAVKGSGVITGKITILLTGKGNAARELRIQGRSADGRYGYWMKPIFAAKWDFVETGEYFSDREIISSCPGETLCGKTLDKNYKGTLNRWRQKPLNVELIGFYYYNTPSTLRVYSEGISFDLILHTVDMWSPSVQKKDFPALVGNPSGEPKLLQGTIEIPENILNSADPGIRDLINRYFRDYHKIPFALKISADDRTVSISSRLFQRRYDAGNSYRTLPLLEMNLINDSEPEGGSFYSKIANDPDLFIPEDRNNPAPENIHEINAAISANEKARDSIKNLPAKLRTENLKAAALSVFGLSAYSVFNGVISLVQLPHWKIPSNNPETRENIFQLGGISYTGGTPMREYSVMNLSAAGRIPEDYIRAMKILDDRLFLLYKIRDNLKKQR